MVQQVWQQEWLEVPHSRRMRQAGHVSADRKTQVNSAVIVASLCHRRLQSGHVSVDKKIQVNSAVIVENQEHKMLQSCNLCVKIFESRTNVGV